MVTHYEEHARKLKIMGHPTRLQILDLLRQGELCVCHIEHALNKRQAYISQQLMTLRDAGLVTARRDGLQVYYRLIDQQVHALLDLLLGGQQTSGHAMLDDCPCPTCSTILITTIN